MAATGRGEQGPGRLPPPASMRPSLRSQLLHLTADLSVLVQDPEERYWWVWPNPAELGAMPEGSLGKMYAE